MSSINFPNWMTSLAFALDSTWLGGVFWGLLLAHLCLIAAVVIQKELGLTMKVLLCIALLELPFAVNALSIIAALPKG
jgi:hypothetical protein